MYIGLRHCKWSQIYAQNHSQVGFGGFDFSSQWQSCLDPQVNFVSQRLAETRSSSRHTDWANGSKQMAAQCRLFPSGRWWCSWRLKPSTPHLALIDGLLYGVVLPGCGDSGALVRPSKVNIPHVASNRWSYWSLKAGALTSENHLVCNLEDPPESLVVFFTGGGI